jgi:hypothetical protein
MKASEASEIRNVLVGHLSRGKISDGVAFFKKNPMNFLSYFVLSAWGILAFIKEILVRQ